MDKSEEEPLVEALSRTSIRGLMTTYSPEELDRLLTVARSFYYKCLRALDHKREELDPPFS